MLYDYKRKRHLEIRDIKYTQEKGVWSGEGAFSKTYIYTILLVITLAKYINLYTYVLYESSLDTLQSGAYINETWRISNFKNLCLQHKLFSVDWKLGFCNV